MPQSNVKYGMNMAFGGAGVFDTGNAVPNVSTQIDYLERLIHQKLYSTNDITNSVALLSLAGNDYVHFVTTNGSLQVFFSLISPFTLSLSLSHLFAKVYFHLIILSKVSI